MRLYETMLKAEPDLFIHCGDTIYADGPLQPEVKLDDGSVWRNVVTPAKSKVAESLDEYRGNYQYNLMDAHMRRFNASVAQAVLWDDHEVRDNWYRHAICRAMLDTRRRAPRCWRRGRGRRFVEYNPLPISATIPSAFTGRCRRGRSSTCSRSICAAIAARTAPNRQATLERRQPHHGRGPGVVADGTAGGQPRDVEGDRERHADRARGARWARRLRSRRQRAMMVHRLDASSRLPRSCASSATRRIRNVVWVTGDVHYCAAHRYDPARARFTEFDPFWEFVAGPLHAGTFAAETRSTRRLARRSCSMVSRADLAPNRPPSAGYQFFGVAAHRRPDARDDRQPARPVGPRRFIASSSRRPREHSPRSSHCLLGRHRRVRAVDGAVCPAQQRLLRRRPVAGSGARFWRRCWRPTSAPDRRSVSPDSRIATGSARGGGSGAAGLASFVAGVLGRARACGDWRRRTTSTRPETSSSFATVRRCAASRRW